MKTLQSQLALNPALKAVLNMLEIAKLSPGLLSSDEVNEIVRLYESRDFEKLFLLFGDLERFPAFLLLRKELNDSTYFLLLGQSLTSECYTGDFPDFTRALLSERPLRVRHHLMTKSERDCLGKLASELTIYRGVQPGVRKGFSWTLSRERAKFFANRHLNLGSDAGIFVSVCKKEDVIAYFEREEEIFIDPKKVEKPDLLELLISSRKTKSAHPKHVAYLRIKDYLISVGELPPSRVERSLKY